MPELPEVETVMRGLTPHLLGVSVQAVHIRQPKLRWPIPLELQHTLNGQVIKQLSRRGKYLCFQTSKGALIIHLGMSGHLRLIENDIPSNRHDHVDILLSNQKILRYNDPRRFGAILWTTEDPLDHPLLKSLGVEPLDAAFDGAYLKQAALRRNIAIKLLIMNSKIVTGVGNIYAAEALFLARIHPTTPASLLSVVQCNDLACAIKHILQKAITQGGTTLKDFINSEGKPGYFAQQLQVYGRAGLPCMLCNTLLQSQKMGQRATVWCSCCQQTPIDALMC